ncbi:hypothetical protein BRC83_08985 [Halobacteriales archaeon QS_1_68_17]|nr:MAG: hypothetical protein BRC83_08985 [Halobacteriales archaeon QS_1_68_17]
MEATIVSTRPRTPDLVLSAIPGLLLAGLLAGALSSVPGVAATLASGAAAGLAVGYALFYDPPAVG